MAKAERPQKATEAPRKPAAAEGKKKEPAGTAKGGSSENLALLEGIGQTQLVTQAISETSSNNSIAELFLDFEKRLTQLKNRVFSASPVAPATTTTRPSPAPTLASGTQSALVSGWREQLWIDEHAHRPPLRLPRATIIGRCLFELVLTTPAAKSTIVEILEFLIATAGHHLGPSVAENVKRYRDSPAKRVRDRANASLAQLFNQRLEWLLGRQVAKLSSRKRWLSDRGRTIFDGWPDWEVLDDAGWECAGRHNPRASAIRS